MPTQRIAPELPAGAGRPLLLRGGTVFDGESTELRQADVLVAGGHIVAIAPGLAPQGAAVRDARGCTVLPGLIDCHVHLAQAHEDRPLSDEEVANLDALRWREARRWAGAMLAAGFTTARDLGGAERMNITLATAVRRGDVAGPDIVACGWRLAPHAPGNVGGLPPEPDTILDPLSRGLRGEDDVRAAVREEIEAGAEVIKLYGHTRRLGTAGEVLDQFSPGELRAAIETAHARGRRVAIHTFHEGVTVNALNAGVDSIEHGTGLTDATLARMAAEGIFYCPTLLALEYWRLHHEAIPERLYSAATLAFLERIQSELYATVERAHRAGVRIVAGSDQRGARFPAGENAREIACLADAGLGGVAALRAATGRAAELLDMADRRGRVLPGYEADLVVVEGNPVREPALLYTPGHVRLVLKHGTVVTAVD